MKRAILTGALACAAFVAPAAQTPPAGQSGQPAAPAATQQIPPVTFKTEIEYVEVDAVVTDERDNLVKGLTQEDFEVYEDGKPQKIALFSQVVIPVERLERFTTTGGQPVVPDVRTNARPFEGRIYVLLLDDYHVGALRSAHVKRAATEFIDKYLGANDVAAVIHASGRMDAAQEFTNDPRLLDAAIDKFMGQKLRSRTLERLDQYNNNPNYQQPTGDNSGAQTGRDVKILDPQDAQRGQWARNTLGTLKNVADFMTAIRGRRKAVLMFSEGIDYQIFDVFDSRDASAVLNATQDAISAASRANVNFYTIDPRGLHNMGDELMEMGAPPQDPSFGINPQSLESERRLAADSLRVLAEQTGGFAAVDTNNYVNAFERIQRENSSYYVLGYYPPSDKRDGRFHKIQVKLKRPGLKVVARKGYAAPKGKPESTVVDATAGTSAVLKDLLNSPLQASGLTLSVAAAVFDTAKENIAVTVEVVGHNLKFKEEKGLFTNTIEVSMLPLEARGKAQQGQRTEMKLNLKPQTAQIMAATAVRMSPRLTLPPGRYQLRVAAREALGGLTGSVFYDLDVPDFTKEKFNMSGVVLTAATARVTPTAKADEVLQKSLPGPPTTRREFYPIDVLALYAEIYDRIKSDVPHTVDVTTRLVDGNGKEITRVADARKSSEFQGPQGGSFGYNAQVPLADVAPGRYLLQVEAKARLKDAKPVKREMLITVVQPPPDLVRPAASKPGEGGGDARPR
jgi:VWFA-related protein